MTTQEMQPKEATEMQAADAALAEIGADEMVMGAEGLNAARGMAVG